ncbi:MAG: hypothetical protein IIC01_11485, partial [Planctomycetes bacterium]|nr:hypothetical protein [Planctomycetota bacterium]
MVSVGALLLPADWTGGLISLVQVLVPFQHAASAVINSGTQVDSRNGADESNQGSTSSMDLEKAALAHQVAALTIRVAELEREVGILTATRLWDVDGARLGASGQLIPAGVVTGDLLPWRSSSLINAGTLQGVRRGAAVTSCHFTVDRGTDDGVRSGLAILLGETLIGWVEQAGTHTARVKLLTDPSVEMKVRIGRFEKVTDPAVDSQPPGGLKPAASNRHPAFRLADGYFWLTGRGNGRMQIRGVKRGDVESGVVQTGDT